MTTVLICDDVPAVRDGLRRSVASLPGVERVDTASSGEEVLARWPHERPDLVLLDVQMPGIGGVETTRRLVREHPEATILMLTVASDREAAATAIASGARGFLHKDVAREELSAALATALTVSALGDADPRSTAASIRPFDPDAPVLTERERQVLAGMSAGKSNAQIGRDLYLSEDTIKTHARRLFRKLEVSDRAQAVAAGFRHGFVS
ncbi:MAG TPA: response regulator transcription factor [Mycobacteriales bacterium]|nr:response regulator transcription factor [Mycobacteriales bacterium]